MQDSHPEGGFARMSLEEAQSAICETCGVSRDEVVTTTPNPAPKFVPGSPNEIFVPVGDVVEDDNHSWVRALFPWGWRTVRRDKVTVLANLARPLLKPAEVLRRDIDDIFSKYLESVTDNSDNSDSETSKPVTFKQPDAFTKQ